MKAGLGTLITRIKIRRIRNQETYYNIKEAQLTLSENLCHSFTNAALLVYGFPNYLGFSHYVNVLMDLISMD
jgi:hypothetical protein